MTGVRRLAMLAMAGALLFPLLLVVVTAVQRDFLHERGWRVLDHGDVTWPSGTALGPYGFLQVANFLVLGLALLALAVALGRTTASRPRVGAWLVGLLALALFLSAFRIDQAMAFGGGSPETWNGYLHGAGFLLLLASALAAMIALGFQLRRDPRWRGLGRLSFAGAAALPLMLVGVGALNGALGFYLFILVLVSWAFVLAWRAYRLGGP